MTDLQFIVVMSCHMCVVLQATLTLGALTYQGLLPPQRDEEGKVIDNKRRAFELYQLAAEQVSLCTSNLNKHSHP